ncbi:VRR-NUC domain-containing protein [Mycena floridula]|nr:VRR-NUC domain-containing protein [Mycena floridula]
MSNSLKTPVQIIFGIPDGHVSPAAEEDSPLEKDIDELELGRNDDKQKGEDKLVSIYVAVLEDAVNAIFDSDKHLLKEEDEAMLAKFRDLDYAGRLLLCRLAVRKLKWQTIGGLKGLIREIGQEGLLKAMREVSEDNAMVVEPEESKPLLDKNGNEIIDLTVDSDDEEDTEPRPVIEQPSCLRLNPNTENYELHPIEQPCFGRFCLDETELTTRECLNSLTDPQVKIIANDFKVDPKIKTKHERIEALIRKSQTQQTLDLVLRKSGNKKDGLKQTTLPFRGQKCANAEKRLREKAIKALGPSVHLLPGFVRLLQKVNIIFYRSTHFPTDLFRPSLFAKYKIYKYPNYNFRRCTYIWTTLEEYEMFERVLRLEMEVEEMTDAIKANEEKASLMVKIYEDVVRALYDRLLEERGKKMQEIKKEEEDVERAGGIADPQVYLARLEAGSICTRIVQKAAEAYGVLREYEKEAKVLESLLGQRFWRRGKRGNRYERRALLEHLHLCKSAIPTKTGKMKTRLDVNKLPRARDHLLEALADPDTHLVNRPSLIKRLLEVERAMQIPEEALSRFEDAPMQEANKVFVSATRLYGTHRDKLEKKNEVETKGIKSLWKDRTGKCAYVEERALEQYENDRYKGFHSETSILTTLFALLFWDIIFADVPGVFETPFQIAPLDLAEDSFYYSRDRMIEDRLKEIRENGGVGVLVKHDDMHRKSETLCVGVHWDLCSQSDLIEIIGCIGGQALAEICLLFCQDYAGRCSGVPDLFVWRIEGDAKECRFVEVKGPGDQIRPNQTVWIDALLRAGVKVDLCHVYHHEDGPPKPTKKERAASAAKERAASTARQPTTASAARQPAKAKQKQEQKPAKGKGKQKEEYRPQIMTQGMKDDGDFQPSQEEAQAEPATPRRSKRKHSESVAPIPPQQDQRPEGHWDSTEPYWPPSNRVEVVLLSPRKRTKIMDVNHI